MNGLFSGVISVVRIRAYITLPIEPTILTPMPIRRDSPITISPIIEDPLDLLRARQPLVGLCQRALDAKFRNPNVGDPPSVQFLLASVA